MKIELPPRDLQNRTLSLGNNKSPGNDGLSKEFYVCNEIHPFLIEALNYSFQHGELSISQRQAVITLIEKKGKDKRLIENWRPISLMNVDTKIAPKAIAKRQKKVIQMLIQCDHTAYVNNRYIREANCLISDIQLRKRLKQSYSPLILILFNIHSFLQFCKILDSAQTLFIGSKHFCIRESVVYLIFSSCIL